MNIFPETVLQAGPRWDGSRILFDIEVKGVQVLCAISRGALEEVSECRYIRSTDLLRKFAESRAKIEDIALSIFTSRPKNATGRISIWSDDIYDPPQAPALQASRAP